MHAMGIEGLPRNYELVYDIYTGANMDLVREFKALGIYKSQHALDELGRKYLPHHFAVDEMEEHAGRIKEEMNALLGILEEEKSSLARYGELVGAAIDSLARGSDADNTAINESMTMLSAATLQRQMRTSSLSEQVAGQKANLDAVRNAIHASETHKFTDRTPLKTSPIPAIHDSLGVCDLGGSG